MADEQLEILVVESDKALRDHIKAGLQSFQRFVVTFAEGYPGINQVRQKTFDYILLGVPAADSEGMQLLRALREFDRDTEAVVLTAHKVAKTMASEKSRLNIFAFIDVPVDVAQFFRTVSRFKKRERAGSRG